MFQLYTLDKNNFLNLYLSFLRQLKKYSISKRQNFETLEGYNFYWLDFQEKL